MATKLQRYIKPAGIFIAALARAVIAPLSGFAPVSASSIRQQCFTEAAAEFEVPQEVLLSVSYNQSRWENHDGKPSVSGGYGLMHLTTQTEQQDGRGDSSRPSVPRDTGSTFFTLDAAAALINVPIDTLKHDDRQNVRAAAALMADFAKETHDGALPPVLEGWQESVARMSGMSGGAQAQQFAANVFASI